MTMLFPKPSTLRNPAWIKAVRELPCCITGNYRTDWMDIVPAHLSFSGRGMSIKAADNHVLPLTSELHQHQHNMPETLFWRTYMTDELLQRALTALAEKIYEERNA